MVDFQAAIRAMFTPKAVVLVYEDRAKLADDALRIDNDGFVFLMEDDSVRESPLACDSVNVRMSDGSWRTTLSASVTDGSGQTAVKSGTFPLLQAYFDGETYEIHI